MTREEAIEAIKCNWPDNRYTILREALDMAIAALMEPEGKDTYVPTNSDRIRTMSDEELAELMRSMMNCDSCGNMFSFKCDGSYEHCLSVCLKWLQQPAEEDDHEF